MERASAAIEAAADRLDRVLFFVGIAAVIAVLALIGTVDVRSLYFVAPPFGLPRDVGGYPTVFWMAALLPMALVMALLLQLPMVAMLIASLRGGRQETSVALRRTARTAARGLFFLAGAVLLLGWVSTPLSFGLGGALLVEAVVVGGLCGLPKHDKAREKAGGDGGADAGRPRRFLLPGRQVAFVTLLFFGCIEDHLPGTRRWFDLRREVEDVANQQLGFFYENERYARHLSEAGWAPRNPAWAVEFEGDDEGYTAALTVGDDGPYRGFRGEIRCVHQGGVRGGGEPGLDAGRPVCEPPAPRTGHGGDFGLFWAATTEGFIPLFIGVPLVVAGLLLGLVLGRVQPRPGG